MQDLKFQHQTKFIAPRNQNLTQYFHRAIIGPNLEPNVVYYYRVGNDITLSNLFFCTAFDGAAAWSPHIDLYGDMGNVNAKSIPRLQRETQAGLYDMIIHVGDFAYNMDTVGIRTQHRKNNIYYKSNIKNIVYICK